MKWVYLLVAFALVSSPSAAVEIVEQNLPQRDYIVAETQQVRPERETPQAVNGNNFTVVAPLFNGSDGNTSYVRLANVNTLPITVAVSIVGSPTGRVYGSKTYTIPSGASQQRSVLDYLRDAGVANAYIGTDTTFSLYLDSSHEYTAFQHGDEPLLRKHERMHLGPDVDL
jgi:hypothetical protein